MFRPTRTRALLALLLALPPCAAAAAADADEIALALERCHDGIHAIEDARVSRSAITFRAGPRDVLVFFGVANVALAEVGGSARLPREARLTLQCARGAACVWSGPTSAEMAAARAEHGVVPLSALPIRQGAFALYCRDLGAARALHRALQALHPGQQP